MMRRHALAGGGGLLSLGMVWSQAMCAKASNGHSHHSAFASAPPRPSGSSAVGVGAGAAFGDRASSAGVDAGTKGIRRGSHQRRLCGGGDDEDGGARAGRRDHSQLIFVGAGSSTAVPSAFLLLHPELDTKQTAIAQLSVATPPEVNKNYRGNTSVLVRIAKERRITPNSDSDGDSDGQSQAEEVTREGRSNTQVKHVQIDTGKTWREGAIRWFPRHGVRGLDGIVLTHDHADAMLGLDDVRSIQDSRKRTPTPVHVSERTDRSVRRVFPYLVGREDDNGAGGRFVAALNFNVFQDFQPFEVGGLEITPFPVMHGEDYVSHGFLFGPEGNKICYISDVSRVPPESMEFLEKHGPMQLLVCDALMVSKKHRTHFW
ncbi:unnamed protein product [Ectocarpus sp. CCAP 1310/34]|nr:unnamed protein product [Ectocarpus sp. CCAP 1310/34]